MQRHRMKRHCHPVGIVNIRGGGQAHVTTFPDLRKYQRCRRSKFKTEANGRITRRIGAKDAKQKKTCWRRCLTWSGRENYAPWSRDKKSNSLRPKIFKRIFRKKSFKQKWSCLRQDSAYFRKKYNFRFCAKKVHKLFKDNKLETVFLYQSIKSSRVLGLCFVILLWSIYFTILSRFRANFYWREHYVLSHMYTSLITCAAYLRVV